MFLDFLGWQGPDYFGGDAFLMNGGDRTLASYDYFRHRSAPGRASSRCRATHEEFFRGLQLHHREGDYLFLHAGIGRDLLAETDVELGAEARAHRGSALGPRDRGLPHELGVTIVYGHTPSADFAGALEPALQHRHRHRRGLRRPPHGDPPARRDPVPGLARAARAAARHKAAAATTTQ